MNKLLRGLIAGYGAKKLGTGCFSTILIFILIWVALGQCEGSSLGERRKRQHIIQPVSPNYLSLKHQNAKTPAGN